MIGQYGEKLAADWLRKNGYEILLRNWRHRRHEIDLIARRDGIVHAVEVKTRCTPDFGDPEVSMSANKLKHFRNATDALMEEMQYAIVQLHVLSITITKTRVSYFFIEDIGGGQQ